MNEQFVLVHRTHQIRKLWKGMVIFMNKLNLNIELNKLSTNISNIFIDKYMPLANGEFVKVYIYLLKCVTNNQSDISVSSLADTFNQTEADILRALRYWNKVGAIILNTSTNNTIDGITFCDLKKEATCDTDKQLHTESYKNIDDKANAKKETVSSTSHNCCDNMVDFASAAGNKIAHLNIETRTAYTPQQLKKFYAQDEFSMLLYAVGTYMGDSLNVSDASTIAYFYDTLHFPSDLIEYLIEYCVTNGHKSMRYIEKVALAWAENGISSVKQAKTCIDNHNETTYAVLNAFGIKNRTAGKYEQDFIKKWTDIYCFSSDLIIEACNRTLRTTHEPSFPYADSILTKWHNANIKTQDDIKLDDQKFEQTQENKNIKKKNTTIKTIANNKFNNFHQRNTDIDSLESALLSNNG